jgi:voltage-gated potassium channel
MLAPTTQSVSQGRLSKWRERVRSVLEGEDPRFGRTFEYLVYALIVVTMIGVTLETLPNLPNNWKVALAGLEVAVVTIFTAEYLLRIFAAPRPRGYILSFWGLVDLLAIAPFYLSLGLDLRAVRALRLLRLFRMLKAFRRAGDRIVDAFIRVREELAMFGAFALMMLFFSGVGIYQFEHDAQPENFASIPHGLWWAVVTMTTVGYGDVYPVTVGGRLFAFFVLIVGLGVIAVPTGLIASALTEIRKQENDKASAKAMSARTDKKNNETER